MKRKHGVAALCLSLLVTSSLFSLTAVAQAALPGESTPGAYKILGLEALVGGESFVGSQEGVGKLLVLGRNLNIKCGEAHINPGNFRGNPFEALVVVLYLKCKAFDHKEDKIIPCTIPAEMVEASAIFFPILHGGELFVLGQSDGGNPLATVILEGAECALPKVNVVSGTISAQAPAIEEIEPLLTFSEAIQKLTGDKLKFGVFEAFVNGSAVVHLNGAHVGCKFGVV